MKKNNDYRSLARQLEFMCDMMPKEYVDSVQGPVWRLLFESAIFLMKIGADAQDRGLKVPSGIPLLAEHFKAAFDDLASEVTPDAREFGGIFL